MPTTGQLGRDDSQLGNIQPGHVATDLVVFIASGGIVISGAATCSFVSGAVSRPVVPRGGGGYGPLWYTVTSPEPEPTIWTYEASPRLLRFRGKAAVSFTKAVVGSGGLVLSGSAECELVIAPNIFEVVGNGFLPRLFGEGASLFIPDLTLIILAKKRRQMIEEEWLLGLVDDDEGLLIGGRQLVRR